MQITDRTTDLLEHYLGLAAAELKVTAGNMANVDTPGFKTRGFDFNAEMHRAVLEIHGGEGQIGEGQIGKGQDGEGQIGANGDTSLDDARVSLGEIDGLVARPDGNNVLMEREGMQMAEAQLKFRTGVALLKSSYAQISEAIHSDSK